MRKKDENKVGPNSLAMALPAPQTTRKKLNKGEDHAALAAAVRGFFFFDMDFMRPASVGSPHAGYSPLQLWLLEQGRIYAYHTTREGVT